jgi:hypothetical protein
MMALLWLDRDRRFFIATASSTLEGFPYSRTRWRQLEDGPARVDLEVRQPELLEAYYSACAQRDQHNHCRQADLMLERKVRTHDWNFRVNCSLLGMIIVDAFLFVLVGAVSDVTWTSVHSSRIWRNSLSETPFTVLATVIALPHSVIHKK